MMATTRTRPQSDSAVAVDGRRRAGKAGARSSRPKANGAKPLSADTLLSGAVSAKRVDDRVAVVGLGHTGLPLAVAFTEAGLAVEGIDALRSRVSELNARDLADRRHR